MLKITRDFLSKTCIVICVLRMAFDPNDAELKESLKYLVLPTEEKLKLRSQPFDAKKACWIPDPKEVYSAGEILEVKGDQTIVQTPKGEVNHNPHIFSF